MKITEIAKNNVWRTIEKYKYVLIVMVVGLLLLSFPSVKDKKSEADRSEYNEPSVEQTEKRLEKSLEECEGVGRVSVTLTLSSGSENIYAEEERKSSRRQENGEVSDVNEEEDKKLKMISEGSGKESALLVKRLTPKYCGALVVCDGADNISVRSQITEAVMSLTGLSSDRISIIKMKI